MLIIYFEKKKINVNNWLTVFLQFTSRCKTSKLYNLIYLSGIIYVTIFLVLFKHSCSNDFLKVSHRFRFVFTSIYLIENKIQLYISSNVLFYNKYVSMGFIDKFCINSKKKGKTFEVCSITYL